MPKMFFECFTCTAFDVVIIYTNAYFFTATC